VLSVDFEELFFVIGDVIGDVVIGDVANLYKLKYGI